MPDLRLRYRPYDDLAEPNVIVDGTPTTGTTLTLSHWPGSPAVPADVEADLSAEMAFRYLDHPEVLHGAATAVSNNHFDQDGLVSTFALTRPEEARARRALLEDLAAAGDFATYRHRAAARASMVVSALTEPERSPFGPLPEDHGELTALLYTEALAWLPDLVDHVERHRDLWGDEDDQLAQSEAALDDGRVTVVEVPSVDLAVVTVADGLRWWGHRFGGRRYDGVHPMALHRRTRCGAVLLWSAGSYRFTYRYESWVQYRSRAIRPRVDLGPLAAALSELDAVGWAAEPVSGLTPELAPEAGQPSSLPLEVVQRTIVAHLASAPPAFDPYVRS
jgi:hypothetical protein